MKYVNTVSQTSKRSTGTTFGDFDHACQINPHFLSSETKCESMEWRTKLLLRAKMFCLQTLIKIMFIIFS